MTKILNQLEVMDRRLVDKNLTAATPADCANIPNGQVVFVRSTNKFYISNQTEEPLPVYQLATNTADGLMSKEDKEAFSRLSADISDHNHNLATSQTAGFVRLDSEITANGQNPVTSQAIYSELANKATANHDHVINANGSRYNTLSEAVASRARVDHTHQELANLTSVVNGNFDNINSSYTGTLTNLVSGRLSVAALDGRYAIKNSSGSIATAASDVTFERNGESTITVQQALEMLMFEPLKINSFTISPSTTTYEVGQSTSEILATWATQGTPQITSINLAVNNVSVGNIANSATSATVGVITHAHDSATTKTIKLTISTTNSNNEAISINSSKSISFYRKIFFGNATSAPADITTLSSSQFENNKVIEFANIGEGICFVAPSSLSIKSAIAGTFENFAPQEFTTSAPFTVLRNGVEVSYRSYLLKPAVSMETSIKITLQ